MQNGRCYQHGGRTPKGDGWHKTLWPNRDTPDASRKMARKIRDRERAAKKRAERLATMTPEERNRHEAWHRARKPGAAADRARRRNERKQAAEMRERLSKPDDRPVSAEALELRRKIEVLETYVAQLERATGDEPDLGVFG